MQIEKTHRTILNLNRYVGLQKIDPLFDVLSKELGCKDYDKVILFCTESETVRILGAKLRDLGATICHSGSSPMNVRKRMTWFKNAKWCKIMVTNIGAFQKELKITNAKQVIFVEYSYDLKQNLKCLQRWLKADSDLRVRCSYIRDTIDQRIAEVAMNYIKEGVGVECI